MTRAYAQGRNRRPRRKDGMAPVDVYRCAERPPEVVAAHIEQLRAIKLRIDTREAREAARRDPRVIATLEHACLRFSFVDDGDVLQSLYRLSLEAIQSAIAVYAAKRDAGSLPLDAGLRYFAGFARNCQTEIELRLYEVHTPLHQGPSRPGQRNGERNRLLRSGRNDGERRPGPAAVR